MLEKKFTILCHNFTKNNKLIKILWKKIELSYSNENRYYHTLSHLEDFYTEIYPFQLTPIIEFSIFYHDIIYDIKRKDNEKQSALLAQKHLRQLNVPKELIKQVYTLIIETKNHQTISSENALFLDADLSILGSELKIYKLYIQNIRKEYSYYSNKVYEKGRREVLMNLLKKKKIYLSDYFYNLYEEKALANIRYELNLLLKFPEN